MNLLFKLWELSVDHDWLFLSLKISVIIFFTAVKWLGCKVIWVSGSSKFLSLTLFSFDYQSMKVIKYFLKISDKKGQGRVNTCLSKGH